MDAARAGTRGSACSRSAVFRDGHSIIFLENGTEIRFPVIENARLARGTAKQLSRFELSPFGIQSLDLDEDLSFRGLLAGDYGQHQKIEQMSGTEPLPGVPIAES